MNNSQEIKQIDGAIKRLKARYKTQLADKSYMENNPDSIGKKVMDAIDRELLRRKIERKSSQLIKLENNPVYHEKIIYSDEEMAGFICAEEFFKKSNKNVLSLMQKEIAERNAFRKKSRKTREKANEL